MAEFCEVMKQKQRMCDSFPDSCEGCPIHSWTANNAGTTYCEETFSKHYEKLEPLILKWAEEHPEPRYPTWIEWQKSIYPEADEGVCPGKLCAEANRRCTSSTCLDCRKRPIPAYVAEKLGIKPIK